MKKLFISIFITVLPVLSQAQNDVSVLSFGTAGTEEHAIQVALRVAIEKAFGTFVSANTLILNDSLVSDEIATITQGNIKSFEVLSTNTHVDQVTVNVRAIVSIDYLISYAKSKGSSAEFAGDLYYNNWKIMQFKVKNTEDALKILCDQVRILSSEMFDYEVNIETPIRIQDKAYRHSKYKYTPEGWSRRSSYPDEYDFDTNVDGFMVPVNIMAKNNLTSSSIYNLVTSTINALEISSDEASQYKRAGVAYSRIDNPITKYAVYLPVSQEVIDKTIKKLNAYYQSSLLNYKIVLDGKQRQEFIWEDIYKDKYIGNVRWYPKKYQAQDYSEWLIPATTNNTTKRLVHVANYTNPYDFFTRSAIHLIVYKSFHIPETKTEHIPTKKEINEIKKLKKANPNYIDVPKYDITYGESGKVYEQTIYLYIPMEEIDYFRGVHLEKR